LDINDVAHVRVQDSFRKAEGTAHARERQGSPRCVALARCLQEGLQGQAAGSGWIAGGLRGNEPTRAEEARGRWSFRAMRDGVG
jgi:hypothetical protein